MTEAKGNQIRKWVDVLKCTFRNYSSNVRPTDQETNAVEKIVCHYLFVTAPKRRRPHHATQGLVGSRGTGGLKKAGDFIVIFTGRQNKAG